MPAPLTRLRAKNRLCGSSRQLARGLLFAAALTSMISFAAGAAAQVSGEAMAESLFVEARRLIEEGDYAAACPKLRASHELDPQLGTLLNLGKCYEKNGQTASAWATFTELSRLAGRAGQKARAEYAAERVEALKPTLAYVTVRLASPVPGVSIRIDDKLLSTAVLGSALPVDPGARRISVQAPDHHPWNSTIEVAASSRHHVEVPPLEAVVVRPAPPPPPPPVVVLKPAPPLPPPVLPPPPQDDSADTWWPVAITGYAVAGAGIAVGSITGLLALDTADALNCTMGACPPSDADTLSRANTLANVANVGFAVAGAGMILGIVATVLASDDDRSDISWRGGVIRF